MSAKLKDSLKRVKEIRAAFRKKSAVPSVVLVHRLEFNHEYDWLNVKIIDRELSYTNNKRVIS